MVIRWVIYITHFFLSILKINLDCIENKTIFAVLNNNLNLQL